MCCVVMAVQVLHVRHVAHMLDITPCAEDKATGGCEHKRAHSDRCAHGMHADNCCSSCFRKLEGSSSEAPVITPAYRKRTGSIAFYSKEACEPICELEQQGSISWT